MLFTLPSFTLARVCSLFFPSQKILRNCFSTETHSKTDFYKNKTGHATFPIDSKDVNAVFTLESKYNKTDPNTLFD